jgi:hypothetical protein
MINAPYTRNSRTNRRREVLKPGFMAPERGVPKQEIAYDA